ncbi:DNA cytosine methyltransferase [Solidesulfovibrio sp.]|uniref:DNA cytosine methyltransferase n=1 Tax=Solidesulfovibrio sp. TaxID=2910990 RepID=UPI0026100B4A|nr:DNA cytosine methyltransferase [Solidesulfovibrio sp.]
MIQSPIEIREITHFHLFCGLGGGAKGFNKGRAAIGNMRARFRCLGGIDVSPAAIADFERLSGVPGTCLDLMDRGQFRDFHGREPGPDWREAGPDDIRRAAGNERPHIVFLSAPCKGFSGLLSETKSQSGRYQALNRLTVRGVWLMLEAWSDDPPELVLFENVPRIATRGRHLLDQIGALLRHYGYAVAETTHDCGELGGLAQSRKRFLLVARHREKVPPFLYQPDRRPLRAVGDVLGRMPLPGAAVAGPMHRMPALQWKTWVRLAFVEAGSDWRSLSKLRVQDGVLADYGIVPDRSYQDGVLGVLPWAATAGTVTGNAGPTCGRYSVADPRACREMRGDFLGVIPFESPAGTVTSRGTPTNGRFSVADPRCALGHEYSQYGVLPWSESMGAVSGQSAPGGGRYAVADPRVSGVRHNNVFRVVRFDETSPAVTGGGGPSAGGLVVADPRGQEMRKGAFGVRTWTDPTGAVIGESMPSNGAFAVADPRVWREGREHYVGGGHYGVTTWDGPSAAVIGHAKHDRGPWSVADTRTCEISQTDPIGLPAPADRLVAVIRALDGTWHRPFTNLELAALQGLVDPEESLELDGLSDQAWRERIGNAVPPPAAAAIAGVMGTTLLLAWSGETFSMSSTPVWVAPVAAALAVETIS